MTKTNLVFLFAAACGTNATTDDHLPSASLTPHTRSETASVACGDDVALYGSATPDLRYTYTYDSGGRFTHAQGVYTAGGADNTIDYTWDSADRFTHMVDDHGWGDSHTEIDEGYDGDNLASYAYTTTSADYSAAWQYTYSDFLGPWQPQREVIAEEGQPPFGYELAYDSFGRLITATPDAGDATTYTYDDTAGTIASDTGNGAWTDVTTYGADWTELSDVWGGSDPSAIAGEYTLAWDGDALVSETYRSGSQDAPTQLETIEIDTLRYDCSSARTKSGRSFHALAPRPRF
jgi:YD repeat-containing protein